MSEDSNKKDKKLDLNKVEEPATEYSTEKTYANIEEHPLFIKVIEKSIKEAAEGKTFTTEEVMKMTKEKYPFLK
jgi:predicted transcriptional regulator